MVCMLNRGFRPSWTSNGPKPPVLPDEILAGCELRGVARNIADAPSL